ncbi:MAG: YtxH domain-containing protein [Bacteroidia bacterium]|nr:YtxH domain-containing protein [Bacteroidota bacterium]MBP9081845.1 YtxH domain-containing protein [Bacteroidia bacterium]MBK7971137.1 YtxH domain-containing protein [Bacteroidota bacterium]MBK8415546.1 YtxH domain-containing protein [Bacteroidota bacterium]MBK8872515.1 YtxH domain-containing protein [Bacteroidota bacterium]
MIDSKNTKYLLALLGGAAAGAVIAVLFAPSKGSDFRNKVKNDFDKSKESLSEHLCNFTKAAEDLMTKFR